MDGGDRIRRRVGVFHELGDQHWVSPFSAGVFVRVDPGGAVFRRARYDVARRRMDRGRGDGDSWIVVASELRRVYELSAATYLVEDQRFESGVGAIAQTGGTVDRITCGAARASDLRRALLGGARASCGGVFACRC